MQSRLRKLEKVQVMHEIKSENDPSSLICFVASMVQIHENRCFNISLSVFLVTAFWSKKNYEKFSTIKYKHIKKVELSSSLQGLMM